MKNDIYPGQTISAEDFYWKNGEDWDDGDVMMCRECETPFAQEGVYGPGHFIHTSKGWQPDSRH